MKTKNRLLALAKIAIVLCSVFLVALPTITAASEIYEPGLLDVFGNANEDDTIDMRDTTYIKLAIFGKKPETDLADANYDGKVSMLDVGQTKLIILGKEKMLTIVNDPAWGETVRPVVTIKKPVKSVITYKVCDAELLRAINVADKIIGVGEYIKTENVYFPGFSMLPSVGQSPLDYEAVLEMSPDVFLGNLKSSEMENLPGITIISLRLGHPVDFSLTQRVRMLGYVFDKREEAEEYINWHDGVLNRINERTKGIPEEEMPRLLIGYIDGSGEFCTDFVSGFGQMVSIVPVNNLAATLPVPPGGHAKIDTEWVLENNPEIWILRHNYETPYSCGYDVDDPSGIAAARDEIMNDPVYANIEAIKTGRVYIMCKQCISYGPCWILGCTYLAKWFYPDRFEDIDPQEIHQEYVDFQGIDYNVREQGVFVYPPPKA